MKQGPPSAEKRVLWAAQGRRRMTRRMSAAEHPLPPPARDLPLPAPRRRRSWILKSLLVVVLLVAVGGGTFGYKIIAAGDKISSSERSIIGQLKDLLLKQGTEADI